MTYRFFVPAMLVFLPSVLRAQSSPMDPGLTGLFIAVRGTVTPPFDVKWQGYAPDGSAVTETEQFGTGGGFGIDIGWGMKDWLTLKGGFDFTGHSVESSRYNSGSIFHMELGARVQVPNSDFSPFAVLTYGSRSFSMSQTSQSGNTIFVYREFSDVYASYISYGAGIRYAFLELAYMISSTSYPDERVESFTTGRIHLGVSLWFELN